MYIVDVIGICKSAADVASIITKTTNKKLSKRELQLVDRSGREVTCTLWGAEAEGFDASNFPVVAVKGARVSDFGGRSLSTLFSSLLMVDPDIPEAHQLRGWFDNVGKNEQTTSLSDQRGGGGGGGGKSGVAQVYHFNFHSLSLPPSLSLSFSLSPPHSPSPLSYRFPGLLPDPSASQGAGPWSRRQTRLLQLQGVHFFCQI